MSAKGKIILLALAVCLGVAVFTALSLTPKEPVYQGRPFSAWLADLSNPNSETQTVAKVAINAMGASAVPYLTNSLAQRESLALKLFHRSPLARKVIDIARPRLDLYHPAMESRNAAIALSSLGPNAKDAVGPLVAALGDPSPVIAQSAAQALGNIGSTALPALRDRVVNGSDPERIWSFRALGRMGTNAGPAAMDVARYLFWDDPSISDAASITLIEIGPPAVPWITNYLDHTNNKVRERAVSTLFYLHGHALAATNVLVALTRDSDPTVRYYARATLHKDMYGSELLTPIWLEGLDDPDPRNVLISIGGLASRYEDVIKYRQRLEFLSASSNRSVSQISSNALVQFGLWPAK